ncbi:YHS domain-containing (seleno)protein [Rhizobium sp. RAF56]|uniref:YHS domain-containing (seleno)protein n=1 Tax=Rhizobium sp. RAF56 TaxID=3233062 RepID=UPI003F95EA87
MFVSRRDFLLLTCTIGIYAGLSAGLQAFGEDTKVPVSVNLKKVAIGGYDSVAYFTDGRPIQGKSDFETEWLGARWWFANEAHRDMFAKQPETYAPRFGGFCAGAMVLGTTVKADPEVWAIIDGKLYLNADKEGLADFQSSSASNIQSAEEHWRSLADKGRPQ